MDIIINQEFSGLINEDYSQNEDDGVVGIFNEICFTIEELKIAKFSVLFKEWDSKFNFTQFPYDFTSIADDLPGLIKFMTTPIGDYSLGFYELDRKVIFRIQDNVLMFEICSYMKGEVLFRDVLNAVEFKNKIEKLIIDFGEILSMFFPKAYKIFWKEKFIINQRV